MNDQLHVCIDPIVGFQTKLILSWLIFNSNKKLFSNRICYIMIYKHFDIMYFMKTNAVVLDI